MNSQTREGAFKRNIYVVPTSKRRQGFLLPRAARKKVKLLSFPLWPPSRASSPQDECCKEALWTLTLAFDPGQEAEYWLHQIPAPDTQTLKLKPTGQWEGRASKCHQQAEIKGINKADGWRETEAISNLSTFCDAKKSSLGMEPLLTEWIDCWAVHNKLVLWTQSSWNNYMKQVQTNY